MGNRSTFVAPDYTVDTFLELYTLPASQATNAQRYQELLIKTNKTSDEITELNNLTVTLQNYIIDPEKWNKFTDCLVNMEVFIKDNVEGYIQTKQTEFNTTLQKFSDKGLFNSTTTYQQWNTVKYNNETYLSKQDGNLNHTPIGDINDAWWSKIAQQGNQGVPGVGLSFVGNYNNAIAYVSGNAVNYDNSIYYCIADNVGHLPTETAYWQVFLSNSGITIQDTAPTSPYMNQIWVDTANNNAMKYWDGSTWKSIGVTQADLDNLAGVGRTIETVKGNADAIADLDKKLVVSDTQPISPNINDVWIDLN